jgi:small subunit ribosomal protein S6
MAMREYELMYIVRPTVPDDQLTAATERVDGFVSGLGGEVVEKQPWGKRRLAYPIEKHEDGYYVVARLNMEPERTHDLEEQLRIADEVIRHLLTLAPEKGSGANGLSLSAPFGFSPAPAAPQPQAAPTAATQQAPDAQEATDQAEEAPDETETEPSSEAEATAETAEGETATGDEEA